MRGEGYEEVRGGVRKHLKSRNSNSLNSPPNPSTLIPSSDETPPLISTLRFSSYSSPPPVHPADSGAVAPCKGGAPPGAAFPPDPTPFRSAARSGHASFRTGPPPPPSHAQSPGASAPPAALTMYEVPRMIVPVRTWQQPQHRVL